MLFVSLNPRQTNRLPILSQNLSNSTRNVILLYLIKAHFSICLLLSQLAHIMASLVSTWSNNVQSLPAQYIMPPERRPGNFILVCKDIPVIDLREASGHLRADLVAQIMKASTEFGLFQVHTNL